MAPDIDWSEAAKNLRRGNISPFLMPLYKAGFSFLPHDGVDVVAEDWEYLIVLDACRYDAFAEVNWLDATLEKRTSRGATTGEWLAKNFTEPDEDIVYVSGNPHVAAAAEFNETINPEEFFHDHYLPYMRDECIELSAPVPECVTEDALQAVDDHPDKRIVIHYMQPHAPYIGEKRFESKNLYSLYADGVPRQEIWEAYLSNLKYVLSSVEELLPALDGRTIITADHGEALGEKGIYGHRGGVYTKELVEVPWFVVDPGG